MRNKVMIWGMILMLFIGQSYSYASVPCESSVDVVFMQKDMHKNMQHNPNQQDTVMDCCDQECSCPTGTCSSATFSQFTIVMSLNLVSHFSGLYQFSIQDAFLASLRKPPIIG